MLSSATGSAPPPEIVRLWAATGCAQDMINVLVGRRAALNLPFERMTQDFEGALRRVHAGHSGKRNFNDR